MALGRRAGLLVGTLSVLVMIACGSPAPDTLGVADGKLAPCPATPNCVNTGMLHPPGTEPFLLRGEPSSSDVTVGIRGVVSEIPRVTIVSASGGYLHAEVRSRIFRFVDDLELLVVDGGELVVRSASRVGRSDLGVNTRRVKWLREALLEAGLLR